MQYRQLISELRKATNASFQLIKRVLGEHKDRDYDFLVSKVNELARSHACSSGDSGLASGIVAVLGNSSKLRLLKVAQLFCGLADPRRLRFCL